MRERWQRSENGFSRFGVFVVVGVCAVLGYIFSLWYLDRYYSGDLEHYRRFYEAVARSSPRQWQDLQQFHLGSSEPAYRWLIGAATFTNLTRIEVLSFFNSLLIAAIASIFLRYRCSVLFCLLFATNFYLLILLGPAERLKFAYIVLAVAVLFSGSFSRSILGIISIFFHNQAMLQFLSGTIYYVIERRAALLESPAKAFILVAVFTALFAGSVYFLIFSSGGTLFEKAAIYMSRSEGVVEVFQWLVILICGVIVFEKRAPFILSMIPLFAFTVNFGSRVNVTTLVMFSFIAIAEDKTRHPVILVVMLYMSLKSIPFMMRVLEYGTGFI